MFPERHTLGQAFTRGKPDLFQEAGQLPPVFDAGFDALRIGIPEAPETIVHHLETRRFKLPLDHLDGFAAPAVAAEGGRLLVPELQPLHLLQEPRNRGQNAAVDRRRADEDRPGFEDLRHHVVPVRFGQVVELQVDFGIGLLDPLCDVFRHEKTKGSALDTGQTNLI